MLESEIEAELEFVATQDGGREGPVFSGYRPHHDFGLEAGQLDAAHEYIGASSVSPGDKVIAKLRFISPHLLKGRLYEGFEFTANEGTRVVAVGRVTKIFRKDLARAV